MYRKQLDMLRAWKERSNRKPLVIRGARQVGKTYLVREFARSDFLHYIEVNFDETPKKQELFSHEDIDTVLQFLSLDAGVPIIPGKTLIFLDEIQRAGNVFARLRYFFEKRKDIHIIAAGSLLDFILEEHSFSIPVGRIEYLYMGPMDFMEYLHADGSSSLCQYLNGYSLNDTVPESIHEKLLDHVRTYMYIGGLPAAVREYTRNRSFLQCELELRSLLDTYRDDFLKYLGRINPDLLRLVLDRVPSMVGRKMKYTQISSEVRSEAIKKALKQLELARIVLLIHHSSGNGVPLRSEKKERDVKLLFLDSGLMMRSLGLNIISVQNTNLITVRKGALAEQFAGQQWIAQLPWYDPPELFYWNREKSGSSAEVDYLFQIEDLIVPVEVKAGTAGSLKSLHVFVSEKKSDIALRYNLDRPMVDTAVSRIPGKPKHPFRLLSLPLYLVPETIRLVRESL